MKLQLPPQMYGGDPSGLIDHLGLHIESLPTTPSERWEVSAKPLTLVESRILKGPPLSRSRFDVSPKPTPDVPGGLPPELGAEFQRLVDRLDESQTLSSRLDRIVHTLIAVSDNHVPATIEWGSNALGAVTIQSGETGHEPLFPRHSAHDVRISPFIYRWAKLPQIFLRLRHNNLEDLIEHAKKEPDAPTFQSSGALLEGTIYGGLYFAPLLGNLSPLTWGFGAPRIGQIIVYTFGMPVAPTVLDSRDHFDYRRYLTSFSTARDFDLAQVNATSYHRSAYADAVDWWASRLDKTFDDIFNPTNYVNGEGTYVPEVHQRWMLNLEQLLSRVGAIARHHNDQETQLMLLFPAMDILGDSFIASNGIGQLMAPSRIRKKIAAIESRVPQRIRPLVMAPAQRALAAAEQVACEFIMPSPNSDTSAESRLVDLWNARRNATHGFNRNAEILAEHSGRLPADIVFVPMVYLLDILTDREHLMKRIQQHCRKNQRS